MITKYSIVALAVLLAACGGGSPSGGNSAGASAGPAAAPISLAKVGHAGGIDLTVTSVATPKQLGAGGVGPKAEAGETFVVVAYTLKNTGDKALPLMDRPTLSLVAPDGRTYEPDMAASMMAAGMMDDASGMAADLNPNVSAKTKAAWKVDKVAFDRGTWRLAVATDPQLTFALK